MADDKKRLNIPIDAELHKKLKLAAVENDTTIVEIVNEAVKKELVQIGK